MRLTQRLRDWTLFWFSPGTTSLPVVPPPDKAVTVHVSFKVPRENIETKVLVLSSFCPKHSKKFGKSKLPFGADYQ